MATKGGAAAAAYPSAARISDSPCYHQYSASLKCESRSRLNHVTARRIVLKSLDQTRVNARIILMCTRNAKRKRGKLDWNAIRHGHCSPERTSTV
ncbi:unnamed protein product [Brassica napus]|uniref:(rape) hypothetical protein n=1 Tax=Brassica napus TaxID=3708 RepID=A0A817ATB1_BRANA|nr:unnamed protein product [Brassica napus]